MPWSNSLRNISTPVTTVLRVGARPTISASSIGLIVPRSMRPVTTVPRPLMLNTSSMGIRNGLSVSRTGVGMYSSTARMRFQMHSYSGAFGSLLVLSSTPSAEPRTTGMSSPGKP